MLLGALAHQCLTIRSSGPLRRVALLSCGGQQRPLNSSVSAHLIATLLALVLASAEGSDVTARLVHQMNFSLIPGDDGKTVHCRFVVAEEIDMSTLKVTATEFRPSMKFIERACALLKADPWHSWERLRGPEQAYAFWSAGSPDEPIPSGPESVR